ncbi:50S ribosomal protein L15 [Candidatus Acidianus copahuensis]|uniref:Large ribosomal subunit protein uL15 n=1 Tax=Candidatus Acidianus copahuensis TaxID=1160895 RepID=A0A031LMD6_9CREN|nr:uL15 family ribosomal protein [Candidatus Acidianus copahuensis]EZQ03841.1 50S ribosomal protein L15 [Candidatus Acidianus copahuensis]
MVVRREKKTRKFRGHRNMGWGTKGQHRDRGSEGGRQIGMHKHKWSWIVKYGKGWYGKHGFVNPTTKVVSSISIQQLAQMLESGKLKAEVKDGKKMVNLKEMGYQKLLGSGKINEPIVVVVDYCTDKAKGKIEKNGGEVILTTNK